MTEEKYFLERHREMGKFRLANDLEMARATAVELVHMFAKLNPRIFDNGCIAESSFLFEGSKNLLLEVLFDLDSGWISLDSTNESGVWYHIERQKIVSYTEGDLAVVWAPTKEAFSNMLGRFREFIEPSIAS